MKKLILTTALVAMFGIASAQTEEGGWYVGASSNLGFTSTSIDGQASNDSEFAIDARAGYFMMDNLNVGLFFGISSAKDGGNDSKSSGSAIGPYARYYIGDVGSQFYVGLGYAVVSAKDKDAAGTTTFEANGGALLLEAGYPVWITDSIAVEPALNYNMGTGDFDATSSFGLAVGFGLYF